MKPALFADRLRVRVVDSLRAQARTRGSRWPSMFVQRHRGRTVAWHSGWRAGACSGLYLKVPEEDLSMILLANGEGLWRVNPLDAAQIEKSPFARAFFQSFMGR